MTILMFGTRFRLTISTANQLPSLPLATMVAHVDVNPRAIAVAMTNYNSGLQDVLRGA